jgi:beta-galactosidase/beta-glucuronidase
MHGLLATAFVALSASSLAQAATPYEVQTPPLDTDWTYKVGTNPWPEHPRPQLRRKSWKSLNGIWTYQSAPDNDALEDPPSGELEKEVLVPSCIESGLSGIQELDVRYMWFAREFEVPEEWDGSRVLLNFEAVDYYATVFVNGEKVQDHAGGYNRFTIDVTDHVSLDGKNDL